MPFSEFFNVGPLISHSSFENSCSTRVFFFPTRELETEVEGEESMNSVRRRKRAAVAAAEEEDLLRMSLRGQEEKP